MPAKKTYLRGWRTGLFTCLLPCLLLLSACASYESEPTLIAYSYHATDRLLETMRRRPHRTHPPLDQGDTLLVSSFVALGQLQKTSELGRLLAEQVASRINQKGYATVEIKLAQEVFIKEGEGEFALSRSLAKIGRQHAAQAMVVGTYALVNTHLYVTVKLVHAEDGYVYAAHDFAIPKTLIFQYGRNPQHGHDAPYGRTMAPAV